MYRTSKFEKKVLINAVFLYLKGYGTAPNVCQQTRLNHKRIYSFKHFYEDTDISSSSNRYDK